MSFSSRDIDSVQFTHSRRGYDIDEVDAFLGSMRASAERMEGQLAEMANRVRAAEEKNARFAEMEGSINNAFISAQASADRLRAEADTEGRELMERARSEGERVYREAESKAREIIRQALTKRDEIAGEAQRLQASENEFRTRLVELLDHYYAQAHANAPAVVADEQGEPEVDETVDEPGAPVEPATPVVDPVVQDATVQDVAPETEPIFEDEPVLGSETEPEAERATTPVLEHEVAAAPVFDPVPAPEGLPEDEPEAGEPLAEDHAPVDDPFAPRTFASSQHSSSYGYAAYGEVDDDLDIEEID